MGRVLAQARRHRACPYCPAKTRRATCPLSCACTASARASICSAAVTARTSSRHACATPGHDASSISERETTADLRTGPPVEAHLDREGDLAHQLMVTTQSVTRALITAQVGRLLMLHAGAVSHPTTGATLVYVAPGGTGKTTLSRLLGQRFGYVTDETVGIDEGLNILPYPKPLSIRPPEGGTKDEVSPDRLGLSAVAAAPHATRLVLLGRHTSHGSAPEIEELTLMDALFALVEQTSSLTAARAPATAAGRPDRAVRASASRALHRGGGRRGRPGATHRRRCVAAGTPSGARLGLAPRARLDRLRPPPVRDGREPPPTGEGSCRARMTMYVRWPTGRSRGRQPRSRAEHRRGGGGRGEPHPGLPRWKPRGRPAELVPLNVMVPVEHPFAPSVIGPWKRIGSAPGVGPDHHTERVEPGAGASQVAVSGRRH